MKIIGFSLAAIAIWSSMAPAYAQQQAPVVGAAEVQHPMDSVTVSARRAHVEPQEFASYEFEYPLNNGDVVMFSRRVGRFYVSIRGVGKTVEIFPTALDKFETKGGAKLVFTEDGDALRIDHYEAIEIASGLPITATPAAPK